MRPRRDARMARSAARSAARWASATCKRSSESTPPVNADLPLPHAPILDGDRRAIARAISAIENGDPAADAITVAIAPHLGRAHVVGITGAPGAGKSTLVNALLGELLAR